MCKDRHKVQNDLPESSYAGRVLKQGDYMTCLLFNKLWEQLEFSDVVKIFRKSLQILPFVDDVNIIGRFKRDIQEDFGT